MIIFFAILIYLYLIQIVVVITLLSDSKFDDAKVFKSKKQFWLNLIPIQPLVLVIYQFIKHTIVYYNQLK
jgi:hypothetical protein